MITPGTLVIHPEFDDPMVWDGESDGFGLQMVAHVREGYTGLRCAAERVAPADAVTVPEKSPRVTVVKEPSSLPYGPRLTWSAYVDGENVTRHKPTRRESHAIACRSLAVRDWHAAQVTA